LALKFAAKTVCRAVVAICGWREIAPGSDFNTYGPQQGDANTTELQSGNASNGDPNISHHENRKNDFGRLHFLNKWF
jgi:hypothetical protein